MEKVEIQDLNPIELKKRSLKKYKILKSRINRLEDRRKTLDAKIKSVKSPNYSGMPRGGVPVSVDELLADKLELEERLERLKEKSKVLKREILEEIDSLDNPVYCEVLESFFIDGLSIEQIAYNEGYTVRHTYRLYHDAVSSLV